jgi:hypothetical protein
MRHPERDGEMFRRLFEFEVGEISERAPARTKARIYSALISEQQATGPLRSLSETEGAGHRLCVFEKLVQIAPVKEEAKAPFFCSVCHARVLAEKVENAPIFWSGCPYVLFQRS